MTPSNSVPRRFLLSLYVSLALAGACLAYAEWPFLPQTVALAVVVAGLMILAFVLEGRWALSLGAANAVGAVIAVGTLAWLALQLKGGSSLLEQLPLPAALLPYLGPFVLVLIPAKLFRPKHDGDYWGMQLIGLMTVALSCAMGGDGTFGALVFLYAIAAVWCLAEFYAVRAGRGAARPLYPSWQTLAPGVLTWALIATGIAIVSAAATPRLTDSRWEFSGLGNRARTGVSDERPALDLNFSGEIQASNEVAFEVKAENLDGSPKLDLSPFQRWRATTFNYYEQGKWSVRGWSPSQAYIEQRPPPPDRDRRANVGELLSRAQRTPGTLLDLGPNSYYLVFRPPEPPKRTYYLGEPLWRPRPGSPAGAVVTEIDDALRFSWRTSPEGDWFPQRRLDPGRQVVYRQVTAPTPELDVSVPVRIDPMFAEHLAVLNGLPALNRFADELLRRLHASGALPNVQLPQSGERIGPDQHEAVARAFDIYLRTSGDFQYSLSIERSDLALDPIEDFVLNVRAGHCNRFSTALALLLRCQRIPCRVVLGLVGGESQADGTYLVRQSGAHSWVEALVRRPNPGGEPTWHWLTLDPTPGGLNQGAAEGFQLFRWLADGWNGLTEAVRLYVLDLNTERQARLREYILGGELLRHPAAIASLIAAGLLGFVALRRKLWPRRAAPHHVFDQLREALRRAGLVAARPSQTPNEVLNELRRRLDGSPGTDGLLVASRRIADAYYWDQFSGMGPRSESAVAEDWRLVQTALRGLGSKPKPAAAATR